MFSSFVLCLDIDSMQFWLYKLLVVLQKPSIFRGDILKGYIKFQIFLRPMMTCQMWLAQLRSNKEPILFQSKETNQNNQTFMTYMANIINMINTTNITNMTNITHITHMPNINKNLEITFNKPFKAVLFWIFCSGYFCFSLTPVDINWSWLTSNKFYLEMSRLSLMIISSKWHWQFLPRAQILEIHP